MQIEIDIGIDIKTEIKRMEGRSEGGWEGFEEDRRIATDSQSDTVNDKNRWEKDRRWK